MQLGRQKICIGATFGDYIGENPAKIIKFAS